MLDQQRMIQRKFLNYIQSAIIIIGTSILIAIAAYLIYGALGIIIALSVWFILIFILPMIDPKSVLKVYNAKKLSYEDTPILYEMLQTLCENAKLQNPPTLYYIKSESSLAFSTGTKTNSAIALSDALFRMLNKQEVYGVLAHEISHIKNNDIWLMQVTDTASKVATLTAYIGQIILIVLLPFLDLSNLFFWITFFIFVVIPPITILLQLSLSRIREYGADLDSAILTGNPEFLKSALKKLDYIEENLFNQMFNPFSRSSEPSILRTHPSTKKRIQRLEELSAKEYSIEDVFGDHDRLIYGKPLISRAPKRRYFHWYY